MNAQLLKARQTQYATYAVVYIVIVFAAAVVANVLGDRYNKSYDATANKRFSLSEQTAKIVKGLKEDATVRYFDQPTRPCGARESCMQEARDLLSQYVNLSRKVHVEYVDADRNPGEARAAGVTTYGTAIVQIGARKEEAKSMTEEGVTGAFIRDLKSSTRTVCFVEGSGEHQIGDSDRNGFSQLKQALGKEEFEARAVNLLEKAEVPTDCTVTVVGGPLNNYLQPEVDALKKYVEEGGRALFMLDPPLKVGRSEVANNDALDAVLQSWGVTPQKDLVLDFNPVGKLVGLGPQVVLVTTYEPHPVVREMGGSATGFPLSRSLEVGKGDHSSVEKLFSSSAASVATSNLSSARLDMEDPSNKKGPFVIAAAGAYKTGKENAEGRFIVVGSSAWAANSFLGFNGNTDLALNMMDWLASSEELISIRPKNKDDRRINLTNAQFRAVLITSQFLLPGLVILGGVLVWWKRR